MSKDTANDVPNGANRPSGIVPGGDTIDLALLIARVGSGDEAAFQQIYQRTSAKLFGVVLRIVKGRELADEVLQDSYLRIWQNASRYLPESGRPMTWMIAIARYAAIDVVRKRASALNQAAIDPPEPAADPERQIVLKDMLGRCLGRLGAPQLECVVLAYCNGYSREELARHFSAQVPTIKTWLHRALNTLRICLEAP